MTWALIGLAAALGFMVGFAVRGRRQRSPIEDYERQQREAARTAELREKAGTPEEITMLLEQGNKIGAIKAFREQTGSGLREAKDAVEAIEREMRTGAR